MNEFTPQGDEVSIHLVTGADGVAQGKFDKQMKKMGTQEKHKFKEVQMTKDVAIQEINRMIDFYRDATSKSDYKSADHSIKQAEKALDYLSNQKLCQCEDE